MQFFFKQSSFFTFSLPVKLSISKNFCLSETNTVYVNLRNFTLQLSLARSYHISKLFCWPFTSRFIRQTEKACLFTVCWLLVPKVSVLKEKVVTEMLCLSISSEMQNRWPDQNLPLPARLPSAHFHCTTKTLHTQCTVLLFVFKKPWIYYFLNLYYGLIYC